eukprot:Gb_33075 [translate_table: standard]
MHRCQICLEPDACNTLQEDELCETISSPSDLFQDFGYAQALDQLGPVHLVDFGRPQQRDGSVLASDWKPSAISENDTSPHVPAVNPVDDARDTEIYGGFKENTCLQNSKLNPNISSAFISGKICQNSTPRELGDITKKLDPYRSFRLEFKKNVHQCRRKKNSRPPISGRLGTCNHGETDRKEAGHFQHGEVSSEHEPVIKEDWRGECILDSKSNQKPIFPGSSYQHSEFGFEYEPHIKGEWSGGIQRINHTLRNGRVEVSLLIGSWVLQILTVNTERRHLPPTLSCGNPLITIVGQHIPPRSDAGFWAKSDDERQTYRAVLQNGNPPILPIATT